MQLSARILTALAVLAFVVGVAVGTKGATDDVSAATGTIDALNVGVCATTNADVFELSNCSQLGAFYQQGELDDLVEVDTLYATYSHDPKTGAELPRAIIEDGDLVRISVTDKDRDRRDPVLVTTAGTVAANQAAAVTDRDGIVGLVGGMREFTLVVPANDPVDPGLDAAQIVADVIDVTKDDLPDIEQAVTYDDSDTNLTGDTTFEASGPYQLLWDRDPDTAPFKPIAPDGVVKFFGRVDLGDGEPLGDFQDLADYIELDEDVSEGGENTPPFMAINVDVPNAPDVQRMPPVASSCR